MTKTLNNRAPPAIRMNQKKIDAKIINTLRKSQNKLESSNQFLSASNTKKLS